MEKAWILAFAVALGACSKTEEPSKDQTPAPTTQATPTQRLGAPITAKGAAIPLTELAASPDKFKGQTILATGTVGSVCQHRGCWMTLKDANGEAFVRMSGHAFAIPKDATGKQARVMATLTPNEADEGTTCSEGAGHGGCKAEAEEQSGKPLAKLELQATGVELF